MPAATIAAELENVLDDALPELLAMDEEESLRARARGAWTSRQVLGHLIDSAANNHQRVVRAQLVDALEFPGYDQEDWVAVQGYAQRPWPQLVELWTALNRHLAEAIRRIAPARLATPCRIAGGKPVTLEFVAQDYVRHLRHHLEQILEPEASKGKKFPSW